MLLEEMPLSSRDSEQGQVGAERTLGLDHLPQAKSSPSPPPRCTTHAASAASLRVSLFPLAAHGHGPRGRDGGEADGRGGSAPGPRSHAEAPGLSFLGERGPASFSSSGQSGLSSGGPIPGPREVLGESGGGTILGERRATPRGAAGEVRGGGPPLGRVQTQMHRQPGARGVWRLYPGRGPEPCLAGPPAGRMACGLPPCPAGSAEAGVASSPRGCPSLITRNERLFVHERKATCMCL